MGVARRYERSWLRPDLTDGVALVALVIPAGMAYAEAAGLPPVTSLYATIVPLLAYAVFGPSRVLVLGPDSSLAPMIAAAVLPLALGDPERAVALAGLLAVMMGVILIAGRAFRLGFVTGLLPAVHCASVGRGRPPARGIRGWRSLAVPGDNDDAMTTESRAPAVLLLASALSDFLATMRDNLPGLLDDLDTEFLHDFRVAVRRTRSTLKLGRAVLPEVMRDRWEPAFKGLGDATTPLRDLDVYEQDLPTMAGWLVSANPADLEPFAAHLRARRVAARRTLVRELTSARFSRLLRAWEQELSRLAEPADDVGSKQLPAGKWAERSVSRVHRKVVRRGSVISAESPAVELHELRKRCKELRYALEVCEPVLKGGSHRHLVDDLKGLQDVLGRFQDCEVQRHALRGFAEEMMATGTSTGAVLAIGELIAHLGFEQDLARREFVDAFARFARG